MVFDKIARVHDSSEARNLESRFNRISSCCEIWIVLILYNNNNSNNNSNNKKNINYKDNDSYNDNDNDG